MTIAVYFATNRDQQGTAKSPVFGGGFHEKGPHYLRFGWAEVRAPAEPDGDFELLKVRLAPEYIPAADEPKSKQVLGSRTVFDELRTDMKDEATDLIVFIHGFSCDFETSLLRAAQIAHNYGTEERPMKVVVFSWPADGTMIPLLSYYSDRDDAKMSGIALSRLFLKALDYFRDIGPKKFCWRQIHLVAHSMGNYVLRQAVQAVIKERGGASLPRVFENIFMMAADEDNDTFELDHKLCRLPEMGAAVHVYYSATDQALTISDVTKGNPDRLGSTGPRTLTSLPHKITLIDCRAVDETALADANHQYYRKRVEVYEDVRAVLAGQLPDQIGNREYVAEKLSYRIREN